jgi:hypothetical protein
MARSFPELSQSLTRCNAILSTRRSATVETKIGHHELLMSLSSMGSKERAEASKAPAPMTSNGMEQRICRSRLSRTFEGYTVS